MKTDGYLVIANCFYPVIKCHLPQIFYLKYTLNQFAKMLGLKVIGLLEDSHATIYKKIVDVNPNLQRIKLYRKAVKNYIFYY
ncbi:hypothetical protein AS144_05145 [Francisella endosymbiont of Amblyomma maculatum]|nr:hypothetical protein AS144_05145 [Francisella endosymbiont of Amblyomma maculatum]